MAKPLNLFEFLTTPQGNATLVEGSQVGAFRRPTHIRLRPALHEHTTVFTRTYVGLFFVFFFEPSISLTALSSTVIGSLESLLKIAVLSPAS